MKRIVWLLFLMTVFISRSIDLFGFEISTHKILNELATGSSNLDEYLKKDLGFSNGIEQDINGKTVKEHIKDGGAFEDQGYPIIQYGRYVNHFHNPLKPWDQAGLDTGLPFMGQSSLLWAQRAAGTQQFYGNYSWHDSRGNFYNALTSTDSTVREQAFADTFRSVGQVMHLVEDASVPAHTRNDAHILYNYEKWVKANESILNTDPIFSTAPLSAAIDGKVPITQFWDTNQYDGSLPLTGTDIGIAEYSNANFLSDDTIFSDDFPYPTPSLTELWVDPTNNRQYLRNFGRGESLQHLAAVSLLYFYRQVYFPQNSASLPLALDDKSYEEQASYLAPRAVGYSAGLLNYFFRGNISISLPDEGVYAITAPNGSFNEIRVNAQNITDNAEEMPDGEIHLVIKYKLALEDPMEAIDPPVSTSPEFLSEEFNYIVVPEANGTRSISRDPPVELVFNLSANPLPILATDVYLQVVYRGVLGGETDAVAVGFQDISEPTTVDVISSLDYVCLDGFFVKAGSLEAELFLDGRNLPFDFDFYAHRLNDVRIKFGPNGSFPDASLGSHNARFLTIEPAQFGRVFVLTEYTFSFGVSGNPGILDPRDDPDVVDFPFHDPFSYVFDNQVGIRHQTDIENQVRVYPLFELFRGIKTFTGSVINTSLPGGGACSLETQSTVLPNLNGPVFTEIP